MGRGCSPSSIWRWRVTTVGNEITPFIPVLQRLRQRILSLSLSRLPRRHFLPLPSLACKGITDSSLQAGLFTPNHPVKIFLFISRYFPNPKHMCTLYRKGPSLSPPVGIVNPQNQHGQPTTP